MVMSHEMEPIRTCQCSSETKIMHVIHTRWLLRFAALPISNFSSVGRCLTTTSRRRRRSPPNLVLIRRLAERRSLRETRFRPWTRTGQYICAKSLETLWDVVYSKKTISSEALNECDIIGNFLATCWIKGAVHSEDSTNYICAIFYITAINM